MTTQTSTHRETQPLEIEVRRVMDDLRGACSGLVTALSALRGDHPIRSATDLQRALDIRATVAWQLYRLASARNPIEEIESVPGSLAVARVIEAARARGLPADRLDRIARAIVEFDRLVQAHAGSRKALHSIVQSLTDDADSIIDLPTRREAFHANSHVWGLQASACLWSTTYFPGKDSDHICAASLRGPIGVKRLRVNAPYVVSGYVAFADDPSQPEPLGSPGDAESPDPRLLVPFCTRPLPQISSSLTSETFVVTEMAPGLVGNHAAATIILADVARDAKWKDGTPSPTLINSMGVATPFEVLVVDTIFHRSMFGRLTPRAKVFGRHSLPLGVKAPLYRDSDTLPVAVHAELLGSGLNAIESPDIPRYPEMFSHICSKLALNPDEFDVYRCRLEYPILHAHLGVWFNLPPEGGW